MVNERDHVKLGFAELARVNVADQWLQYHFNSVDDVWIVFALEERDGQPPKWRRIHASWGHGEAAMYGAYKKGAAWEVHTGQRKLRGKTLPVEKYLAEIAKLPTKQLSDIGALRPMCRKSVEGHGLEYIDRYYGHERDKTSWDMSEAGPTGPFLIPLSTRQNMAFLQRVDGSSDVYLASATGSIKVLPTDTLDLFA